MAAVTNRSGEETSNARIREKGDEARTLKGNILNVDLLLLLSGLVDIYEQLCPIHTNGSSMKGMTYSPKALDK